ncbi:MAG: arginine--tRNA ligase [Verrucomicrobia bacterium]|nr:arginine--tRNA ligase [Verrucomicrobiota bacterium]MBS0636773.1 arginine--tRNA ligase [Verrucomicrobiota bacterium]
MSQVAHTVIGRLQDFFTKALQKAFPDAPAEVEITQGTFTPYQYNSAMKLSKPLKMNPRQIAEQIIAAAGEDAAIEKLEVAGPGFINITLKSTFLENELMEMLKKPNFGIEASKKQKVVIDFSSPNTAKEMHVGHLRSTIIGDTLARLFEFLGDDVLRLNHVGDWGTSFGMLIAYIKKEVPQGIQNVTLTDLVAYYKAAKQLFDADESFKKAAQLEVVALQGGDKATLDLWKAICQISRTAYQEIYDLLDIRLNERGESFYNPLLQDVVADLEKRGLVEVSEGAKVIYLDGFQNREGERLPLMIQKSDGGYNYDTTDMAAIRHRVDVEKAERIIIVTDAGQATHFQMVFQAAIKAKYVDPAKVRLDHVPFGVVLGADGKKFRTRSGETEKLIDLINAAVIKAEAIVKERNPDWAEEEQKQVAKALGINAIKYSDLVCHRISDYMFSYDKMLRFEGNTAAFVMYSYVRIQSIIRKVGVGIPDAKIALVHPAEVALGLQLVQFAETVDSMAEDLLPNRLTEYLYKLAETFNHFFRDCRVEGSAEQNSRLQLIEATRRVLGTGMQLLGLTTVERM